MEKGASNFIDINRTISGVGVGGWRLSTSIEALFRGMRVGWGVTWRSKGEKGKRGSKDIGIYIFSY